ncbi:hypothetical protein AAFG07_07910 [Bradyrhizobium sp. B097]|uniref:hypothetical protein n=1 Tax=Bradyrhizobium sp. B097 TaxID=3140244 RepID=UPI003183F273
MSSWCDKLGSTPAAGVTLSTHFVTALRLLDAFAPILDLHEERTRAAFTVDEADNFSVTFNTNDGYKYGADHRRVHVTFNHRMRAKNVSGGAPIMEMLSEPLPYTQLLPKTLAKLTEAALLIPKRESRTISRVGIVSTTVVSEDIVPPGIARMLSWMGKPWGKLTDGFSIQLTAEIDRKPGWTDRCAHTLLRTEHAEDLLTLVFDFQRTYNIEKPVQQAAMSEIFGETERAALRYFEDLAEGNRFDEIDVGHKAG